MLTTTAIIGALIAWYRRRAARAAIQMTPPQNQA